MSPIQSHTLDLSDLLSKYKFQRFGDKLPEDASRKNDLRKAANEFEVLFMQQVMKSMRNNSFDAGLVQKSEGEKVFESMLDEQYAKLSTQSGGLGLGEIIYQQYKTHIDR